MSATGPGADAGALERRVRAALTGGEAAAIPPLADGDSARRLATMLAWAQEDLALGRVLEAHVDAVQILREQGRRAEDGSWYAVWAAEGGGARLCLRRARGGYVLDGAKPFCSGAGLVDRALVTASTDDGNGDGNGRVALVDVALRDGPGGPAQPGIDADAGAWQATAFSATGTGTVTFHSVAVPADRLIGPPGWYLDRPGFWHGACGPAACWAGGAARLVEAALDELLERADDLADVAAGALAALDAQNRAVLDAAGRAIDRDPDDAARARVRALLVRHAVERACAAVLDGFGRALGPRPLAFDPFLARQHAELTLYIRQCHAERDLRALGRALRAARTVPRPLEAG